MPATTVDQSCIDATFASWLNQLTDRPDVEAIAAVSKARQQLDVFEAKVLARAVLPNGDDRQARRLLELAGGGSSKSRRGRVARAHVVKSSDRVEELWASGALCGERVDVLVAADRSSNNAASSDPALIDELVEVGVDSARKSKDEWLARRVTETDVERRYKRQRLNRDIWRHRTASGQSAVTFAGDDASVDAWWRRMTARADAAYRSDGGRGVSARRHRRTYKQRLYDAAVDVIDESTSASSRPAAVVTFAVDATGMRCGPGEMAGYGPITDEAAKQILVEAELWTLLVDPIGRPLWMGRSVRQPTRAQLLALIARDRGCVETGEHWQHCQAHHSPPWASKAAGRTDIDQMVLLGRDSHRRTHADEQTWIFDEGIAKWRKRSATPDEIAPKRPGHEYPKRE